MTPMKMGPYLSEKGVSRGGYGGKRRGRTLRWRWRAWLSNAQMGDTKVSRVAGGQRRERVPGHGRVKGWVKRTIGRALTLERKRRRRRRAPAEARAGFSRRSVFGSEWRSPQAVALSLPPPASDPLPSTEVVMRGLPSL